MPVPKYDDICLPLLRLLADGAEHHLKELSARVGDHFNLSDQERNALLPSQSQTYLRNRTGWAGFHLRKAGLAEATREATLRITPEGRQVLENPPPKIDRQFLTNFEPFRQFIVEQKKRGEAAARTRAANLDAGSDSEESPPEERIDSAFAELRETLVSDLSAKLATVDPFRFEQVVLDLLVAMGYGGSRKEAAQVTQKTGDDGIDGVINEDRLGLDVIYIQAKRWKQSVGREQIQNFVGALAGKKAGKGVFITTGSFSDNARAYAAGLHQKVILIDGQRLAELMIQHDIGVAPHHTYILKRIDSDYFDQA